MEHERLYFGSGRKFAVKGFSRSASARTKLYVNVKPSKLPEIMTGRNRSHPPGPATFKPRGYSGGGDGGDRHAVIARRISFGTRTDEGSRFYAAGLSVVDTCRKRGADPWVYACSLIAAARANLPSPPSVA